MVSLYFLLTAALLPISLAIPTPTITITQTVYSPEPTPFAAAQSPSITNQPPCIETAPLTTSWQTEYILTSSYYATPGLYPGLPGCGEDLIAFIPSTITCTQTLLTAYIAYADDLSIYPSTNPTLTTTTIAVIRPQYTTVNATTAIYATIWTEHYVSNPASGTVHGAPWTTMGIPTDVVPYPRICTAVTPQGVSTASETPIRTSGSGVFPYPADYNDPRYFRQTTAAEGEFIGYLPSEWSNGPPAATATGERDMLSAESTTAAGMRNTGYPSIDYNDPNVFRPYSSTPSTATSIASSPSAVAAALEQETTLLTTTAVNTSSTTTTSPPFNGASNPPADPRYPNYPTIDYNDPSVFRPFNPLMTGLVMPQEATSASVSDGTVVTTPTPRATSAATTMATAEALSVVVSSSSSGRYTGYPSIDYSDPSVFRGYRPAEASA